MSDSTNTQPAACPPWCEHDSRDVHEFGDLVHSGPLMGARATLHDSDPNRTLEEAAILATIDQEPGGPVHVVLVSHDDKATERLTLDEAEQLAKALTALVAMGRGEQ